MFAHETQLKAWITGVALLASSLSGCVGDEEVNLGHDDAPARVGVDLSEYSGTWIGYAEAFSFADDTATVQLSIDAAGNGVMRVGDSEDQPAPSLDEDYPVHGHVEGLVPGFDYTVENALVESDRLQLHVTSLEIYADWCALFEPVPQPLVQVPYACLPPSTVGPPQDGLCEMQPWEGDSSEILCSIVKCVDVCACDETSCGPNLANEPEGPSREHDVLLDAALEQDGRDLVGTLVINQQRITVRMTRQ